MPNYWKRVRDLARVMDSDGCTAATSLFRDCCYEHDIFYRTHTTLDGAPISRRNADRRFLHCMQRRSILGWWTPIGWLRYFGVRLFGGKAWKLKKKTKTR